MAKAYSIGDEVTINRERWEIWSKNPEGTYTLYRVEELGSFAQKKHSKIKFWTVEAHIVHDGWIKEI